MQINLQFSEVQLLKKQFLHFQKNLIQWEIAYTKYFRTFASAQKQGKN